MTNPSGYNYEEALHGVLEAKTALQRAQALMEKVEKLLSEEPRHFEPVAEPALRLRDRLIEDVGALEARLAEASAAANSGAPAAGDGPRDVDPRGHGVPLGDSVYIGGQ